MAGPTTQSPYKPVVPRPAAGGVSHPKMRERSSPQSGGDRYGRIADHVPHPTGTGGQGPKKFVGEPAEHSFRTPRLPSHKAYSNSTFPLPYTRVKGNSEGRAEMLKDYHDGHETDTIQRFANNRLSRGFETHHEGTRSHLKAQGDEFSGQPFRHSYGAFGPQRKDRLRQDHLEHENSHGQRPGRRLEGGGDKSHRRSTV